LRIATATRPGAAAAISVFGWPFQVSRRLSGLLFKIYKIPKRCEAFKRRQGFEPCLRWCSIFILIFSNQTNFQKEKVLSLQKTLKMQRIYTIYLLLSILLLGSCAKHNYLVAQKNNVYSIDNQTKRDTSVENLITPYRTKIEGQMNEIIATLDNDLIKVQPECTLGNLVADLMMEYCNENKIAGQVAVVNYNGLRIPGVTQGEVARSKIFEIMPFDNAVVLLQLNKTQVVQLCDAMAQKGGWHISKGLRFEIHDNKSQNISINGQPLMDDKIYPFVMSDYVANGGDNCSFLTSLPQTNCNILIRDMLLKQIEAKTKRGEHLSSAVDGRCVKK
jgi:hypothetical protein